MPFRSRLDRLDQTRDICHFYLDDYRFETTWNRAETGTRHVQGYWATCTPDFSLYPKWPAAMQIWNTYRSRWLGRMWQEQGVRVIPTLNWSDETSWKYCFDGIPVRQIATISVSDLRNSTVKYRFLAGLDQAIQRLLPRLLLVYGHLNFDPGVPVLEFDPDWKRFQSL